jgi:hypothetical protein
MRCAMTLQDGSFGSRSEELAFDHMSSAFAPTATAALYKQLLAERDTK